MMTVRAELNIIEKNGNEVGVGATEKPLIVESHDIHNGTLGWVILRWGNTSITVDSSELNKAILSCTGLR